MFKLYYIWEWIYFVCFVKSYYTHYSHQRRNLIFRVRDDSDEVDGRGVLTQNTILSNFRMFPDVYEFKDLSETNRNSILIIQTKMLHCRRVLTVTDYCQQGWHRLKTPPVNCTIIFVFLFARFEYNVHIKETKNSVISIPYCVRQSRSKWQPFNVKQNWLTLSRGRHYWFIFYIFLFI